MGRANRKYSEWIKTHPDRAHWTDAQRRIAESMTEEAYEALYGRRQTVARRVLASPLFPGLPSLTVRKLEKEGLSLQETLKLWEFFQPVEEALTSAGRDPLLQKIFESELRRLRKVWPMDSSHWAADLQESELQEIWFEYGPLRLAENWQEEVSPQLRSVSVSLLSAVIASGRVTPDEIASSFRGRDQREQGKPLSEKWSTEYFRDEILPQAGILFLGNNFYTDNPTIAHSEVWDDWMLQALQDYLPSKIGPVGIHETLLERLQAGDYQELENFRRAPLYNSRGGDHVSLSGEFLEELLVEVSDGLSDSQLEQDDWLYASRRAERALLARQTIRILHGVREDSFSIEDFQNTQSRFYRAWTDYIQKKGECPLQNLLPLFRGIGAEGDLRQIIGKMDEDDHRWRRYADRFTGERIETAIYRDLRLSRRIDRHYAQNLISIISDAI